MIWRRVHAVLAIAWVAAIVVQVYLAGQAIANLGGSGNFETHIGVGYTIGIIQLAVVLTAFAARMGRRDAWITIGVLVLYVVQTMLPAAKGSAPWVAALHPLNAMLLFTISVWYAWHAWRGAMREPAPPAAG